jgi:hypothetical protein
MSACVVAIACAYLCPALAQDSTSPAPEAPATDTVSTAPAQQRNTASEIRTIRTVHEDPSPSREESTEPAEVTERPAPARRERTHPDQNIGIVAGPTIGASGIAALGTAVETQTPYGVKGMFLYPTGVRSHVRAKAGVPSVHNANVPVSSAGKRMDPYVALEHEWGWRYFGIGLGAAYTYMFGFDIDDSSRSLGTYTARYKDDQALSLTCNLRAGKPNGGFLVRASWPLPYMLSDNEPDNFLLEYSALGVFGGRHIKAGIGVQGLWKHREAAKILYRDTSYTFVNDQTTTDTYDYRYGAGYEDFRYRSTDEVFALIPCLKLAGLIADHLVVGCTIELGGTVFPRFWDPNGKWWKPYLGLDIVYSFGKLDGPDVMDGAF